MRAIEEQTLRSEGNGPVPWSVLQAESLQQPVERIAGAEPSTKDDSEVVRPRAFTPPGSRLDRRSIATFPLGMNNNRV